MATRGPGEKTATEPLIRQEVIKKEGLDLKKEKETFVAANKDFAKVEASTSQPPGDLKADEEVKPFLHACMKLLRNPKAMENLQASIDSCVEQPSPIWKSRTYTNYIDIRNALVGRCS